MRKPVGRTRTIRRSLQWNPQGQRTRGMPQTKAKSHQGRCEKKADFYEKKFQREPNVMELEVEESGSLLFVAYGQALEYDNDDDDDGGGGDNNDNDDDGDDDDDDDDDDNGDDDNDYEYDNENDYNNDDVAQARPPLHLYINYSHMVSSLFYDQMNYLSNLASTY
ncbi:hypothetical protein ElyMa_002822700 [Elysia marginata]|uniref:Uncharacterized protein n=1 Tax=Elysia marginata TaxID=1093978 RepID=A0AAV4HTL1_9GAST|nr:hypothetical protein ElyMa_002822700 [Elysia marginata]